MTSAFGESQGTNPGLLVLKSQGHLYVPPNPTPAPWLAGLVAPSLFTESLARYLTIGPQVKTPPGWCNLPGSDVSFLLRARLCARPGERAELAAVLAMVDWRYGNGGLPSPFCHVCRVWGESDHRLPKCCWVGGEEISVGFRKWWVWGLFRSDYGCWRESQQQPLSQRLTSW